MPRDELRGNLTNLVAISCPRSEPPHRWDCSARGDVGRSRLVTRSENNYDKFKYCPDPLGNPMEMNLNAKSPTTVRCATDRPISVLTL